MDPILLKAELKFVSIVPGVQSVTTTSVFQMQQLFVYRQLGYRFNGSQVLSTSNFSQASGPIFLDELACTGIEDRVEDCGGPAPSLHTCTHAQDTAIR